MKKKQFLIAILAVFGVSSWAANPLMLEVAYPTNGITPQLGIHFFATSDLGNTNLTTWPLLASIAPGSLPFTFSGTNAIFRVPLAPAGLQRYIVAAGSNEWGFGLFSNVATNSPLPSGGLLRITP